MIQREMEVVQAKMGIMEQNLSKMARLAGVPISEFMSTFEQVVETVGNKEEILRLEKEVKVKSAKLKACEEQLKKRREASTKEEECIGNLEIH